MQNNSMHLFKVHFEKILILLSLEFTVYNTSSIELNSGLNNEKATFSVQSAGN